MIVAIEHTASSAHGAVTELHCPQPFARAVASVIRRMTGEHPVAVPLENAVVYFVRGLSLAEACAVLRLITVYREDPGKIDRSVIEAEVVLERQEQARSLKRYIVDMTDACF